MEDLSRAPDHQVVLLPPLPARKSCATALRRALDGCSDPREPAATQGSTLERLRHIVRRQSSADSELPYVTLLLRCAEHRDRAVALARRREFDATVTALVADAVATGQIRSDVDPRWPPAALRHGELVDRVVPAGRPGQVAPDDVVRASPKASSAR